MTGVTSKLRRAWWSLMGIMGFLLSPLSWWNDLVVNVPLAYLFSWPFTLVSERLFLPAFLLGYWLTNLLGLLALHASVRTMAVTPKAIEAAKQDSLLKDLLVTSLYTLILVGLVLAGWLKPPAALLARL